MIDAETSSAASHHGGKACWTYAVECFHHFPVHFSPHITCQTGHHTPRDICARPESGLDAASSTRHRGPMTPRALVLLVTRWGCSCNQPRTVVYTVVVPVLPPLAVLRAVLHGSAARPKCQTSRRNKLLQVVVDQFQVSYLAGGPRL